MPSKLLVPLDGSVLGEVAVSWAACLARTAGHSIVLAQAVPWPLIATEGMIGAYASPEMYDDILNAECEEATNYLDRVRVGLVDQGLQVEVVVRAGAPTTAVLDIADETDADLIVMATHGRGGLLRLVLGSFASYVVQHAIVPVMLVRPGPDGTAPVPSFDHSPHTTRRLCVG
jgi:nucleotide-binding universal stress UspA family protein